MVMLPDVQERITNLQVPNLIYGPFYAGTYKEILNYFAKNLDAQDVHEDCAKLGVALCYSWMPTICKSHILFSNSSDFFPALQLARTTELDEESLEKIVKYIGGSVIATSKFLHFLKPQAYAIWDSRVAQSAYGLRKYPQYNISTKYLSYLRDLRDLKLSQSLLTHFREKMPYATELRMKELALFHLKSGN